MGDEYERREKAGAWSSWERMRPELSWACGWEEEEGQREAGQEGQSQRLMAVKEDAEGRGKDSTSI